MRQRPDSFRVVVSVRSRSAVLVAVLALAGCSSGDDDDSDGSRAETTTEARLQIVKKGTLAALISCAESAGYGVDRRDDNLVVITGQGQLSVERMPSHPEAAAAAKAADLIESRVVGRLWLKYGNADESLRTDVDTCALTGSPDSVPPRSSSCAARTT